MQGLCRLSLWRGRGILRHASTQASGLKGKVALITGASSGVGAGAAKVLAAKGANVILAARSDAGLAVEKEINALGGGRAFFVRMDVRKPAEVEAGVQLGIKKFGELNYVFANAGEVGRSTGPVHTWALADIDSIIDINVKGVIWTVHAALPSLLKAKNNAIVVCSSIAAALPPSVFAAMPGHAMYSITKAATDQIVRGLAGTYAANGLRVYGCNPNWVNTPLAVQSADHMKISMDALTKMNNTKKLAEPEEIGETVATMMEGTTLYQSGECVLVESGPTTWSMQVYYGQLGDPKAVIRKLKVEGRDMLGAPKSSAK
eukprot:RCo005118